MAVRARKADVAVDPTTWQSLTGRYVPPDGPWNARIVALGESPWTSENAIGKPFQGPSGNQLNSMLMQAGLSRSHLLVHNFWPYYNGSKPATLTVPEREYWCEQLRRWLSGLPNVRVVVPMGNFACYALTGRGGDEIKGIPQDRKIGIDALRGSMYDWTDHSGRTLRVIPTLHPAHILQGDQRKERRTVGDWRRIAREADQLTPEPNRSIDINPSGDALRTLWTELQDPQCICSIDVENTADNLTCCGFATDPHNALIIPLYSTELRQAYLPWLTALCASPAQKVLQYGLTDCYKLKWWLGVDIANYTFDLGCMHHACHPRENHSLNFLSSWFLPFHRFWKDENKIDWGDTVTSFRDKMQQHLYYNGLDNCIQRELFDYLSAELDSYGMRDFYLSHYTSLFPPLLSMMLEGVCVDRERLLAYQSATSSEIDILRAKLSILAGEDLWVNKKPSRAKLMKFFYETLGLPKQTKITKRKSGVKERSVTLDATALLKLAKKHKTAVEPAQIVIQIEHLAKELSTWYDPKKISPDGRIHCTYGMTTDAGRFNSKESPTGEGYNLQNVKRSVRDMYLPPRPDWLFLKPDLSAAEDRVVKMIAAEGIYRLTGASPDRMAWMANRRPHEADAHKEAATFAFGCTLDDVTKDMRQTAKVVSHGSQRGMSGQKLSDKLMLDFNIHKTPAQCQRMVDNYLASLWEIRDGYFPWIRQLLIREFQLTNNWGRVWRIENSALDGDLFRKGYSFNPQSDVRDLMSQWGILPLVAYLRDTGARSILQADMHDGLLIACPVDELHPVSQFLVQSLERPRYYYGRPLIIPVTLTISTTWRGGHEWTQLPSRFEMEERAMQLLQERSLR